MKALMKIELERAFRSKGMLISLIIGLILALTQFIMVVIPKSQNIYMFFDGSAHTSINSVFNSWFGMDPLHPYYKIYLTIFPILSTLAYAVSYFEDRKKGIIKGMYTRTTRRNYLFSKYMAVFISGGVVVIVPVLVNLMLTASVLPSLLPATNGHYFVGGVGMFAKIFYTHPYCYTFIYILMYFLYGGVFASLALACSYFFDYSFFVILFPFVIYYGLGLISPYIKNDTIKYINPQLLLSMSQPISVMEISFFGEAAIIGFVSLALYLWKGEQDDIF